MPASRVMSRKRTCGGSGALPDSGARSPVPGEFLTTRKTVADATSARAASAQRTARPIAGTGGVFESPGGVIIKKKDAALSGKDEFGIGESAFSDEPQCETPAIPGVALRLPALDGDRTLFREPVLCGEFEVGTAGDVGRSGQLVARRLVRLGPALHSHI